MKLEPQQDLIFNKIRPLILGKSPDKATVKNNQTIQRLSQLDKLPKEQKDMLIESTKYGKEKFNTKLKEKFSNNLPDRIEKLKQDHIEKIKRLKQNLFELQETLKKEPQSASDDTGSTDHDILGLIKDASFN